MLGKYKDHTVLSCNVDRQNHIWIIIVLKNSSET